MVLRFRFEVDDLARTRFVEPSTITLTVFSVRMLQRPAPPLLGTWYRWAHRQLPQSARPLLDLIPPDAPVPGFLAAPGGGGRLESAYEAIRAVSDKQIRADIQHIYPTSAAAPEWIRRLADGDADARRTLIEAIGTYHDACLADYWPVLRDQMRTDLAYRAQLLVTRGIQHILETLHPSLRWRSPFLERHAGSSNGNGAGDIELGSRGLLLCPVPFVSGHPRALHPEGPPGLAYCPRPPVSGGHRDGRFTGDALAELIGPTRAAIARTLIHQPSTSKVAQSVNISLSTASLHVKALRNAGLVTTQRVGKAVEHTLTDLGLRLLETSGG